jgi:DNA helicase INO80
VINFCNLNFRHNNERKANKVYNAVFSLVNNNVNLQRKATSDKQTSRSKNSKKMSELGNMPIDEPDDAHLNNDSAGQKPKRPKRTKKNVNEKLEEVYTGTATILPEQTQYPPSHDFSFGGSKAETVQDS